MQRHIIRCRAEQSKSHYAAMQHIFMAQHGLRQHAKPSPAQPSPGQARPAQHSAAQHSTAQHSAAQRSAAQRSAAQHRQCSSQLAMRHRALTWHWRGRLRLCAVCNMLISRQTSGCNEASQLIIQVQHVMLTRLIISRRKPEQTRPTLLDIALLCSMSAASAAVQAVQHARLA